MIQRIGVSCIIWDRPFGIVLTKRTKECRHSWDKWALPGGAMEDGDASIIDTANREIMEEIGIPIEVLGCLGVQDERVIYPNDEGVLWVDIVLACIPLRLDIKNCEPTKFHEVIWADVLMNNSFELAKISANAIKRFQLVQFTQLSPITQCLVNE